MLGGSKKHDQTELEKAQNELKQVEKTLAIVNTDLRNYRMKIANLQNINIRKQISKLAEIRWKLIECDVSS